MSDEEFDRRLREALIRRPELIVEAIEAYRDKMEADAAAASEDAVRQVLPTLMSGEAGHAVGASLEEAELVIVEFFDYHCGFCRRALDDVLTRIEDNPKLRVVFHELPILREESRTAALTALAAGTEGPDSYRKVHKALMESGGVLDDETIRKALRRAKVDADRILTIRKDEAERLSEDLEASIALARELGIGGTPFFVIADPDTGTFRILEGYRTEDLEAEISSLQG